MAGFYHMRLRARRGFKTYIEVREKLSLAIDWIEYDFNTWILYTNKDADVLYARFQEFAKPDGELFICRLDVSERQGWMHKSFWDWIKKNEARLAKEHGQ